MSSFHSGLNPFRARARRSGDRHLNLDLSAKLTRRLFRPALEWLEDRIVPDAVLWNVATNGNWNVAANWLDTTNGQAQVPGSADSVTINQSGITVTVSDAESAGTLTTASGALLAVTAGSLTIGSTATLNGGVDLSGGSLSLGGATALGGTSQWTGGTIAGSGALTNGGTLDVAAGSSTFTLANALNNTGTIDVQSGTLSITGTISQVSGTTLTGGTWDVANNATLNFGTTNNLTTNQANVGLGGPNAVFTQFETVTNDSGTLTLTGGAGFTASGNLTISGGLSLDTGTLNLNNHALTIGSNGNLTLGSSTGLSGESQITNSGTFAYDASGTMTVTAPLTNQGGTLNAESGTLSIQSTSVTWSGGTFVAATNAALQLDPSTSGFGIQLNGAYTGSGGGQIQLSSGTLLIGGGNATFDFPAGLFQWTGGNINSNGNNFTNTGFLTLANAGTINMNGSPVNKGEIDQTGAGNLSINGGTFDDAANGVYNLSGTGGLVGGSTLSIEGTVKMTGSGTDVISAPTALNSGTFDVESGTLAIQSTNCNWSGGTLNATNGTLELDPVSGNGIQLNGTYTGSGGGQVQLSSGTLLIGGGNATFDFPAGLFQWTGGNINSNGNNFTNTGFLTLANAGTINMNGSPVNKGEIDQTGAGNLSINGGTFDDAASGVYNLSGTGGLVGGSTLSIEGTVKMTGSGTDVISAPTALNSGKFDVESGTLATGASNLVWTNGGIFDVAAGGVLDLSNPGGNGINMSGTYGGSGGGQVKLTGGTLAVGTSGATFNFPQRFFQWTGGTINGSLTNTGFLTINNTNTVNLGGNPINKGEIDQIGAGNLSINGGTLDDPVGGVYNLSGTGGVVGSGTLSVEGTFEMTGTGTDSLTNFFALNGGTIEVESGTLATDASNLVWSHGGTFDVAANGILDLSNPGGNGINMTGSYTGSGGGQVHFTGGALVMGTGGATFDFPRGQFQWSGGTIAGSLTNTGSLTIDNTTGAPVVAGTLVDKGEIDQTGSGNLDIFGGNTLDDPAGGVYNLSGTGGIIGGNLTVEGAFKMTGSGTDTLTNFFALNGGTIDVESGTLATDASNLIWTNGGTFEIAAGSVLDLSNPGGNGINMTGIYTGSAGGQVHFTKGALVMGTGGATFDFPQDLFQWSGGSIGGSLTNVGSLTIDNTTGAPVVAGTLVDKGEIDQTGSGNLDIFGGNTLDDPVGGVYNLSGTGGIIGGNLTVEGTFQMTGTGTDTLTNAFALKAGTIDVASGTLATDASNLVWTNGGTFDVAAGGVLDLGNPGGNGINMTGTYTGTGGGEVKLTGGTLVIGGGRTTTFDFPSGLFQCTGGTLNAAGGTLMNDNNITLDPASGSTVSITANFVNQGEIDDVGPGTVNIVGTFKNASASFLNAPGAVYTIDGTGTLGGGGIFINQGTINKTGSGISLITNAFELIGGALAVQSGTLSIQSTNVFWNGGTLTTAAGGTLQFDPVSGNGIGLSGTYAGASTGQVELTSGNLILGAQQTGDLNSVTFDISGNGFQWTGGTLSATNFGGTLTTLTNEGQFTVAPGIAVTENAAFTNSGTLSIDAGSTLKVNTTFTQTSTGALSVQLGGTGSGQSGQLVATAATQLDGTLTTTLVNGYSPANGDAITVLQYPSEKGTFAKFTLSDQDGIGFTAAVNAASVVLKGVPITSDLALQSIDSITPATGVDGQNETVKYTVINNGAATPVSSWLDSVFLSADGILDSSAVLLGRVKHSGAVAAGGTYQGTLTAALPGVLPGNYSVIVETDSQGVVPDFNRTNNVQVSSATIPTTVAALSVGNSISGSIGSGQEEYFQVNVPSGQDIVLTAHYATANEAELETRLGNLPNLATFDQTVSNLTNLQPQLILSGNPGGSYFILLDGSAGAGTGQSFTLTAQPATLTLQSIGVTKGANSGTVTVPLEGTEFQVGMQASLIGPAHTVVNAQTVQFISATQASATFDLTGVAVGTYDVSVTAGGVTQTLHQAFQVITGSAGQLKSQIVVPSAVRSGTTFTAYLEYQNTGATDLPAPIFILSAGGAANLSFGGETPTAGNLILEGASATGLAGVVTPGEQESILVTVQPTNNGTINFQLSFKLASATDLVPYSQVEQQVLPAGETLAQFDPLFHQVETEAGPTWGGFVTLLAKAATELGLDGTGQGNGSPFSGTDVFGRVIRDIENSGNGAVSGTLFLNDNTHPLAAATIELVTADGSQGDAAVSFNDGSFAIPPLPAGTYNLAVEGFLLPQPVQVVVSATGSVTGLDVTVESGATISGDVQLSGTSAALASVTVTATSDQNITLTTQTAADGSYQLTGLPAGTYSVTAGGGSFDLQTSSGLSVASDQTVSAVNFLLDDAATLQGTVVQASDGTTPIGQATVLLVDSNGVPFSATTDDTGAYSIGNLHPGNYTLTVTADGFAPFSQTGVALSAGNILPEPTISLVAAATLTVSINASSSAPIVSTDVELSQSGAEFTAAETDSNGQATLAGVPAGIYQLQAFAEGFFSASETVTVAPGQSASFSFTLHPAGQVQGVVTDGSNSPLPNVPVLLLGQDGSQQTVTTTSDGSYAFDTLDPGSYVVSVGQSPGIDPTPTAIASGNLVQTVNFTLSGATISGTVVEPDGTTPVASEIVALVQGNTVLVTSQTDSTGSYEFEGVASGTYLLDTAGPTGVASPQMITVGSTSETVAPLQLGALQLAGTVQDPANQPVAGANVLLFPAGSTSAALALPASTDANGDFTITSLAAGQYTLAVVGPGFPAEFQQITVSSSAAPLLVQLQSGTTLSGVVDDLTTMLPIAQATVDVISTASNQDVVSVQANSTGAYQVTNLPPGTYNLVITDPQGTHALAEIANIVVSSTPVVVDAQLPAASTLLQGTVTDSQNRPIANVTVQFTDTNGNVLATATSDFNGRYSTSTLPPGTYGIQVAAVGYQPAAGKVTLSGNGSFSAPPFNLAPVGVDDVLDVLNKIVNAPGAFTSFFLKPLLSDLNPQFAIANVPNRALLDQLEALVEQDIASGQFCLGELKGRDAAEDALSELNRLQAQYQMDFDQLSLDLGNKVNAVIADIGSLALSVLPLTKTLQSLLNAGKIGVEAAVLIKDLSGPVLTLGNALVGFAQNTVGVLEGGDPPSPENVKSAITGVISSLLGIGGLTDLSKVNIQSVKTGLQGALSKFGDVLSAVAGPLLSIIQGVFDVQDAINAFNSDVDKLTKDKSAFINAANDFAAKLQALRQAIIDCHKQHQNNPANPPDPNNPQSGGSGSTGQVGAHDPNDLFGPAGVGSAGFVTTNTLLPYTIDFENEANATAPAQVVTVTEQLDPNLDFSTFQFGTMGFGNTTVTIPAGVTSFSTQVDATATVGVLVDLAANLNVETGLVTWTFSSIDPTTLDVPVGNHSLEGFLPPDTNPPMGDGFVTYTVSAKPQAASGTVISAQASVVFDTNAALPTNTAVNTLDAAIPPDQLALQPPTQAVAGGKTVVAIVTEGSNGQADPLFTGLATIALAGGPKGGTLTGTLTAPFVNGVATFTLTASTAGSYTLLAGSSSDLPAATATLTVVPPPKFKVTLSPASGGSGSSFTATVSALLGGKPDTAYRGSVVLTSSDPQAASITGSFANASNGTLTLPIVLDSAGKQTVTVADATLSTDKATSNAVTVGGLPLTLDHFIVSGVPATDVVGAKSTVTILAVNAADQTVTSFTGTVTLTSSDGSINLPVTFTSTNKGVATVSVTFAAPGTETLTAIGSGKSGTETGIVVVSPTTHLGITVSPPTIVAGKQVTLTVTGLTAKNKTDALFADLLQVTTSDPRAQVVPASNTGGVQTFTITFDTAGTQTITITDLSRPALKAPSQKVSVTAAAPSQLVVTSAPLFAVAGLPVAVTVTAEDVFGNTVLTGFSDKVTLSTGQSATFSKSDKGKHVFLVPFSTAGTVALTASDSTNSSVTASSAVHIDVVSSAVGVSASDPTGGSGEALIVVVPAGGGTIQLMATNSAGTSIQVTQIMGKKKTTFGPFTLTTADHIIVYGTTGNDVIQEIPGTGGALIAVPAILLGGSGNNTLSAQFSSAGNVLVGGAGKDSLTGGSGADVLIGGGGADTLKAGSGGDVLIGGSTTLDDSLTALAAMLAEWSNSSDSYTSRVQDLFGTGSGGQNGNTFLNQATLINDAAINQLFGGSGQDWFWLEATDRLSGEKGEEIVSAKS